MSTATIPCAACRSGSGPTLRCPRGFTAVTVRAASLNHHDLWSLRGVGLSREALPMILGCDAAGVDEDGNEVVVHSVITSDSWLGDETLDPRRSILSERYQGTFANTVAVPRRNLVAKPPELSFEEAACLPTAWLTAYRMLFTRARLFPGMTVLVQGATGGVSTAVISLARGRGHPRVGHEPRPRRSAPRRRAGRRPGVRARSAAARAGRRRDGDGGRGHLGPLRPGAQAWRDDRCGGHDHRRRPARRAQANLLPSALGGGFDDGDARGARAVDRGCVCAKKCGR